MTTTTAAPPVPAQPVTYGQDASIARFTVAKYQQMIAHGILTPADKVELLENYVVLKMTRNPRHDGTIQYLFDLLRGGLPAGWGLRSQLAVTLVDSQPEPDFAVVRGDGKQYLTRHPGPADIGLVVEVADSSLLRDQRDKTRIYARAGIPAYWIINLMDQRIEVYTNPSGPTPAPAYTTFQTFQPADSLPLVVDGNLVATLAVADLLLL